MTTNKCAIFIMCNIYHNIGDTIFLLDLLSFVAASHVKFIRQQQINHRTELFICIVKCLLTYLLNYNFSTLIGL